MSSTESMNKYWIPGQDIHKKVIVTELQYYLGPEATVRPYTREGDDGFLITTPGPCLSDEQIDDICIKSREMFERQFAARHKSPPSPSLKRPKHQPILVARSAADGSLRRRRHDRPQWRDDRSRVRSDKRLRLSGGTEEESKPPSSTTKFPSFDLQHPPFPPVKFDFNAAASSTLQGSSPALKSHDPNNFLDVPNSGSELPGPAGLDTESSADTIADKSSLFDDGASCISSNTSFEGIKKSATEELTELLLGLDEIYSPCQKMLSTIGPRQLEIGLCHIMSRFGQSLRHEASYPAEIAVAAFILRSCTLLATQLVESLSPGHRQQTPAQPGISPSKLTQEERRTRLDLWLKHHSSSDEEEWARQNAEVDDSGVFLGLESVKSFIADSRALKTFCSSIELWADPRSSPDQLEEDDPFGSEERPGTSSSVDGNAHRQSQHGEGSLLNNLNTALVSSFNWLKALIMPLNPPIGSVKVAWK